MKRHAPLLGLLVALAVPDSAFALREIMVGNQPIGPGMGFDDKTLDAINVPERVLLSHHEGTYDVYFKAGGPHAVNEALRRFAALSDRDREIVVLPVPAPPLVFKDPIPYDWQLHLPVTHPGGRARGWGPFGEKTTLTIYIPNPLPPAPADPKAVRRWIADLARDDFKTREKAAKELAAVGPPAAALVRAALTAGPPAEARDRLEKLLAGMSRELRADVLEFPAGLPVLGLDDLLARDRKRLADRDPTTRGHAAGRLVEYKAIADEVVPDLEKLLTTETDKHALCGAVWAAPHLGAAARPLLPALRKTATSADEDVARMSKDAIQRIEAAKPAEIPDAEAKKRATIRTGIREFLAGRGKGK